MSYDIAVHELTREGGAEKDADAARYGGGKLIQLSADDRLDHRHLVVITAAPMWCHCHTARSSEMPDCCLSYCRTWSRVLETRSSSLLHWTDIDTCLQTGIIGTGLCSVLLGFYVDGRFSKCWLWLAAVGEPVTTAPRKVTRVWPIIWLNLDVVATFLICRKNHAQHACKSLHYLVVTNYCRHTLLLIRTSWSVQTRHVINVALSKRPISKQLDWMHGLMCERTVCER